MISFFKVAGLGPVFSSQNPTTKESQSDLEKLELKMKGHSGIFYTSSGLGTLIPILLSARASDIILAKWGVESFAMLGLEGTTVFSGLTAGLAICSFGMGALIGTGINYLPNAFGAKKTIGDHLGDAAFAVFGPCDRRGTFFKIGEFLGLA